MFNLTSDVLVHFTTQHFFKNPSYTGEFEKKKSVLQYELHEAVNRSRIRNAVFV